MSKATKKSSNNKKEIVFEEALWDAANKLRGSVESAEYKHIVLSLIFLKFISDKFEAQREKLQAEGMGDYVDMVEFYTKDNVFYLPEEARWSTIQKQAKQDDIAVKIDTALHTVEKTNTTLKGALPDNYFSRLSLDVSKLAALIDTINNINTVANECDMSEEDLVGRVYEYFLGKFAANEGKGGGEFFTPKSVVTLISDMLEPYKGKIYDPCCGTGTFLAEVIKTIAPRIKDFAPSLWSSYIERDLIPRVHGFELLMASYAMCHLKLEMILRELGYRPTSSAPRQSVYLTNSLEEGAPPNYELPFMNWLADEAKLANTIKNDMPIMCVVGNPPYLGESSKASPWLEKLMEDYKKEPGGTEKLKEKNSKWLNDMYVKFMRMSSSLIEKNEEGILGFISNHGYLDNPTFRGMRWHLLKTFEKIWILDLHGNAKRKEAAPNGVSDKNVFDIMQGVAIIIAVKKKENTNELAEVYKGDLWGSRASKYSALDQCTLSSEIFKKIDTKPPLYQFLQQDWSTYESYEKGVSLNEFMPLHGNGIVTKRDGLNIHKNADGVRKVVQDFIRLSEQDLRTKYKLKPDVRDWRYEWAKKDIEENISNIPIQKVGYRIFDQRFMFYSGRSRGLVGWPVADVMSHYIRGDNIGLLTTKAHKDKEFAHAFVTDLPSEAIYFSATTGSNAMNFPLYVYPEGEGERQVNFDTDLYSQLRKIAADGENNTPDELDTFDYIYGVLYCPKYRSSFDEFLKSNFPKIPWPANANEFWAVSRQGRELRKLHLLNAEVLKTSNHPFEGVGHNIIETTGKGSYSDEKVWINEGQYFSNVNERIWNFYIGGYQPLQKWLKDRKGQELTIADVKHYQRIIKAIEETLEIMGQIHITL